MPYLKDIECMRKGDLFYSPLTLKANEKHEEGNINFVTLVRLIQGLWLLQTPERMPSLVTNVCVVKQHLQSRFQHLVAIPVPGPSFSPPVPSAVTLSIFILPDIAARCLTEPLCAP